jgi:hypothetical protein
LVPLALPTRDIDRDYNPQAYRNDESLGGSALGHCCSLEGEGLPQR